MIKLYRSRSGFVQGSLTLTGLTTLSGHTTHNLSGCEAADSVGNSTCTKIARAKYNKIQFYCGNFRVVCKRARARWRELRKLLIRWFLAQLIFCLFFFNFNFFV